MKSINFHEIGNVLGEQGDIGNQFAALIMSTFSANSYETAIVRISVAIVYSSKMSKLSSEIRKQNKLTMWPVGYMHKTDQKAYCCL